MKGRVAEQALGATSGDPVANVEIKSTPTISNVNLTNDAGEFSVEVACDATRYTLTAVKLGYHDKSLEATADVESIDLAFTMERDDKYSFVTITVLDAATSEPLDGAEVSTAAVGAQAQFTTNGSGTLSFPFPANGAGAIRMAVLKTGYGTISGDYSVNAGTFEQISGKGMVSAGAGGLTFSLVKTGP